MAVGDQGLESVLSNHEKRIRDLERRPLGCLEFHGHFYVVVATLRELPPAERYGGIGVGYLTLETGFVWAWSGTPPTFNDGGGTRTLADWLPPPPPP
jgi:hypothetical protein